LLCKRGKKGKERKKLKQFTARREKGEKRKKGRKKSNTKNRTQKITPKPPLKIQSRLLCEREKYKRGAKTKQFTAPLVKRKKNKGRKKS
jgi:hypothetical protein